MSVLDVAKQVLWVVSPISARIVEALTKSSLAVEEASDKGVPALTEEVYKQNIIMGFEEKKAKIAQELAIAHRILNAEVVEIEEFYDNSGSGQVGLTVEKETTSLGLGVAGKSVTKRIYQFKGRHTPPDVEGLAVQPEAERLKKEDSNGG